MKSQKTLIIAVAVFVLALSSWAAYALVIDKTSTNYFNSENVQPAEAEDSSLEEHQKVKRPCGGGKTGDHTGSVFDDVKGVNIIVAFTTSKYKTEEGQALLPKPLQKKNIEKLYKKIYTERFAKLSEVDKFKGLYPTKSRRCYNRNNQPVNVLDLDVKYGFNSERYPDLHRKDVLTVVVRVRVQGGDLRRPRVDHNLITISTLNYRPYDNLNVLDRSVFDNSATFLSTSTERDILLGLAGYISDNII